MNKEKLLAVLNQLSEKNILTESEKNLYLEMAEQDIERARAELYLALQEKLFNANAELIDTAVEYVASLKTIAQASDDKELLKIANDLDNDLADGLGVFDKELDALNTEYQKIAPEINKAEKGA
jgi:hypothetical protein